MGQTADRRRAIGGLGAVSFSPEVIHGDSGFH